MVQVKVRLLALLFSFQPETHHERFAESRFLEIWNQDRGQFTIFYILLCAKAP
jgi:hypothetical protein